MKIEFPLLSIASLVVLIFFSFFGETEIYSIDIDFKYSSREIEIAVNPVFAVWIPKYIVNKCGGNAFAYGNVMVLPIEYRGDMYGEYLLAHESNHVEQFYAIGWLLYPAQFFINIEPPSGITMNWHDPAECDRNMWLPPPSFVNRWDFITIYGL